MKLIKFIQTVIIVPVIFLSSCNLIQQKNAIEYNNALINEYSTVVDSLNNYTARISGNTNVNINKENNQMYFTINKAIKRINALEGFKDFPLFKLELLKTLDVYAKAIAQEYSYIMKLNKMPIDEYTTEMEQKGIRAGEEADAKIKKQEASFFEVQKSFAKKYKFILETEGLQEENLN